MAGPGAPDTQVVIVANRLPVDQDVVDRRDARVVIDIERRRRIALRIQVDH